MISISQSQTKNNNTILSLALDLAGLRGWYVFPCHEAPWTNSKGEARKAKEPYTKNGFKDATTDPKIITAWWNRWPAALIGVYAEKSGFFAVDVDDPQAWTKLVETYGNAEPVVCAAAQQTPRGGTHLLFKLPPGLKVPNNAGKIAPGIDLRSNGYICTGPGYTWLAGQGPENTLTDAPAWLLDKIAKMTEKPAASPAPAAPKAGERIDPAAYFLNKALSAGTIGTGDQVGFELALQLRDAKLPENVILNALCEYVANVRQDTSHPFTAKDAQRWLDSALKKPAREPAIMPLLDKDTGNPLDLVASPAPAINAGSNGKQPQTGQAASPPSSTILHTELGNSRRFSNRFYKYLRFTKAWGWMIYDGQRWVADEIGKTDSLAKAIVDDLFQEALTELETAKKAIEAGIKNGASKDTLESLDENLKKVKEFMGWAIKSQTAQKIKAILSLAESDLPARAEEFDLDPWLLNCQNGVLNLHTGQFIGHDPSQMITKIIPVDYDPDAICPIWENFLDKVLASDSELIKYIQRAVGYSLTGLTIEQCFFFLFGRGKNGKSTFIGALTNLLGDYSRKAAAATFMQKYNQNGPSESLANLAGARFVVASELSGGMKFDETTLKDLTGGDQYTARKLYKDEFTYLPVLKLWLYGNDQPKITGTDDGIWRRVHQVPFEVVIPENEVDKALPEKLKAELPGILAWAVRGCVEWQLQGLGFPKAVEDATQKYKEQEDVLNQFITECCVKNPTVGASITSLHDAFKRWGGGWSIKTLGQELRRHGYIPVRHGPGMFYKGIGLPVIIPTDEDEDETPV